MMARAIDNYDPGLDAGDAPAVTRARSEWAPPTNLPAEAALLGAMLLADHARTAVRGHVDAGDFYRPAHAEAFRAILTLADRGDPVDVITVAAEANPDLVPPRMLIELQTEATSTTNAVHHARMIAHAANLRRTMLAANALAERARGNPDDLDGLLDAVKGIALELEGVAAGRPASLDWTDIPGLLAAGVPRIDADILHRTDGHPLIYAGRMHVFQAEPSVGKTWVALAAVAEVLRMPGNVVYLDYEDSPGGIVGRLLALGVNPAHLADGFAYVRPDGAIGAPELAELGRRTSSPSPVPDLIVIDGVAEALARDGLDEDRAPDWVQWVERIPRPFARRGSAVLMLDHVAKAKDSPARYARGSSAKLATPDGAAYRLTLADPYSRTKAGAILITIAKDRAGGVGSIGEVAAVAQLTPYADGERVDIVLRPPSEATDQLENRPTYAMGLISDYITGSVADAVDAADVVVTLERRLKPHTIERALKALVASGNLEEIRDGSRRLLRSARPFPDPIPAPDTLDL